MKFEDRLRRERELLGLKQKDIALKLDLPTNTYNGYETGKRSPSLDVTAQIADALGISVDYLLGRTNIKRFNAPSDKLNNILELLNELDESKIEKIETIIKNILTLQEK